MFGMWLFLFVYSTNLLQVNVAQSILRAPPRVETKQNFLDSYVPAGMQIIVHLTELMKYDIKPQTSPLATTSTTLKPTPSHKPGIFSPSKPPGPHAYFANGNSYQEYVRRLQQPTNYFERYSFLEPASFSSDEQLPGGDLLGDRRDDPKSFARFSFGTNVNKEAGTNNVPGEVEKYFDKGFVDVYKLINRVDNNHISITNEESLVQDFLRHFDDSDFRYELLRQKKVPPTKAYVGLLSLYDLLNKESKRLGLNKYNGYTDQILHELHQSSLTTSAHQLKTVLSKILEREDTKKPDIVKKMKQLVTDLDDDKSYLNEALANIPPLHFAL